MGDCTEADVIRAKADAQARILEARAKLHPVAQALHTIFSRIDSILGTLGCLTILLLGLLLFFGVDILALFR